MEERRKKKRGREEGGNKVRNGWGGMSNEGEERGFLYILPAAVSDYILGYGPS